MVDSRIPLTGRSGFPLSWGKPCLPSRKDLHDWASVGAGAASVALCVFTPVATRPSLSLLGKEFMAVATQLSSRVFSAPPPCGSPVEGAQSHLGLGVSQAAEGVPPRIWPLVCAVRSSLRNFSPGSPTEDPRVPVVSCSFRLSHFC